MALTANTAPPWRSERSRNFAGSRARQARAAFSAVFAACTGAKSVSSNTRLRQLSLLVGIAATPARGKGVILDFSARLSLFVRQPAQACPNPRTAGLLSGLW